MAIISDSFRQKESRAHKSYGKQRNGQTIPASRKLSIQRTQSVYKYILLFGVRCNLIVENAECLLMCGLAVVFPAQPVRSDEVAIAAANDRLQWRILYASHEYREKRVCQQLYGDSGDGHSSSPNSS